MSARVITRFSGSAAMALSMSLVLASTAWPTVGFADEGPAAGESAVGATGVVVGELSGAQLFEACAGCHSFGPGEPHRNGPNLWDIGGQRAATRAGFTYSEALSNTGFTWNRGTLTAWILATDVVLPGTWMVYHNTLAPEEVGRLVNYILDTPAD